MGHKRFVKNSVDVEIMLMPLCGVHFGGGLPDRRVADAIE